jgi:hypothetical protein
MKTRVGAVMSADQKEIRIFGFGVYVGNEVPPPGVMFMGQDLNKVGMENPKIVLDGGKVVWGCECWWAEEAVVKSSMKNRKVVEVDIDEERKRAAMPPEPPPPAGQAIPPLTKVQRRYLDAIRRSDWPQVHKDGKPAIRRWARDNGLVERGSHAGSSPQKLTDKAIGILERKD